MARPRPAWISRPWRPRLVSRMARRGLAATRAASSPATASSRRGVGGHQHRGGVRVVFRLGQQILGHRGRVGGAVGDHQHLRRPRHRIDAAACPPAGAWPRPRTGCRGRPPGPPRVPRRPSSPPPGRRPGCRAPPAPAARRRPAPGVGAPGLGRGDPDDAGHPGHLGRDHGHGQGGRIEGPAAGDVDAGGAQGQPALPGPPAPGQIQVHVTQGRLLALGEAVDARHHDLQVADQAWVLRPQPLQGRPARRRIHPEAALVQVHPVQSRVSRNTAVSPSRRTSSRIRATVSRVSVSTCASLASPASSPGNWTSSSSWIGVK